MYAVVRNFTGAPTLGDELKKRSKEVESAISTVPGFMTYFLLKTSDGIASFTVCESQASCDESTKRATAWLRENLPQLKVGPPQIITGEVAIKFATQKSTIA